MVETIHCILVILALLGLLETKKTKTSAKDLEPIKATESNLLDAASQVH